MKWLPSGPQVMLWQKKKIAFKRLVRMTQKYKFAEFRTKMTVQIIAKFCSLQTDTRLTIPIPILLRSISFYHNRQSFISDTGNQIHGRQRNAVNSILEDSKSKALTFLMHGSIIYLHSTGVERASNMAAGPVYHCNLKTRMKLCMVINTCGET